MKRTQHGFTLIEILLVVALIGLISAIGVIIMQDQRNEAARAACTANIITLNNAALLYRFKSGELLVNQMDLLPDYLRELPRCPFGEPYRLDENGEFIPHSH
ncbi:MAG: prepilin-type N-terminal cleavage/methylation domain-containing protein [Firmicutes bacterium]|nr:prepilin-type N-terminal cleavage/methylation domain-containing protein [Bacillota bacterium]